MAHKSHEREEHENLDRWMVSYADFITLLFAFFVVMYAMSQVNEGKYRVLSNSLVNAFGRQAGDNQIVAIVPPAPQPQPVARVHVATEADRASEARQRRRERMQHIAGDILAALSPLVKTGQVRVSQTSRGVSIEINASVLFAPGQAMLEDASIKALTAVALVLRKDDHAVQVEGHTDNVPIKNSTFPSNWELSAVRAGSVVRLFIDNGMEPGRLTAVGYSDNRPVESNESPEGRARNRRVTVMILEESPETPTELPVAAANFR